MPTLSTVFVTFDFVGFHRWPDAPPAVAYLRSAHRHLFKVHAEVSVEHHNRDIEYHTLKQRLELDFIDAFELDDLTRISELDLGVRSCETIANSILLLLQKAHPARSYYRVEVSEDGENGSVIEEWT